MGTRTEEEKLALGSSDLKFLLTTFGIRYASQGKLHKTGISTLAKFTVLAASEDDLKEVLKPSYIASE